MHRGKLEICVLVLASSLTGGAIVSAREHKAARPVSSTGQSTPQTPPPAKTDAAPPPNKIANPAERLHHVLAQVQQDPTHHEPRRPVHQPQAPQNFQNQPQQQPTFQPQPPIHQPVHQPQPQFQQPQPQFQPRMNVDPRNFGGSNGNGNFAPRQPQIQPQQNPVMQNPGFNLPQNQAPRFNSNQPFPQGQNPFGQNGNGNFGQRLPQNQPPQNPAVPNPGVNLPPIQPPRLNSNPQIPQGQNLTGEQTGGSAGGINRSPADQQLRDRLQKDIERRREAAAQSRNNQPQNPVDRSQFGDRLPNDRNRNSQPSTTVESRKPSIGDPNSRDPFGGNAQPGNPSGQAGQPRLQRDQVRTEVDKNPDLKNRLDQIRAKDGQLGSKMGDVGDQLRQHREQASAPDRGSAVKTPEDRLREAIKGRSGQLGSVGNDPARPKLPGKNLPKVDLPSGMTPIAPVKIERGGNLAGIKDHPNPAAHRIDLSKANRPTNPEQMKDYFDKLKQHPQFPKNEHPGQVDLDRVSGRFQERLHQGQPLKVVEAKFQQKYHVDQQLQLHRRGDVARQLNLNTALVNQGGWTRRPVGPVAPHYTQHHFSHWYPGPGWYPAYCWTPNWSPWVNWSWWDWCLPLYDPRAFICRPVIYDPCPPIVIYDYPIWQPLPLVTCGTWVDVPPVVVDTGFDLELLAVRFVDPGHPEQDLGPRYRVWVRNNSLAAIGGPFNIALVAANGPQLLGELPQAGVTVPSMDAGAVLPVDIRLPSAANKLGRGPTGQSIPFSHLHVLVDSHRDVAENNESNNGAVLDRGQIFPVDPAAFSTDVTVASPGDLVSLAGEGFGPEPGQLLVTLNGVTQQAEVQGWYDLGVYFQVPLNALNAQTAAQVMVVRGDGAVSNPIDMDLAPQGWVQQPLANPPLPPAP